MNNTLHVVTPVANPLLWKSRIHLARSAVLDWLREPNVEVWLGEVAYGNRAFELDDIDHPRFHHIPFRANTLAWSKECILNLVTQRLPGSAQFIGFIDADVHWRNDGWAQRAIDALQLYPVIQPWQTCLDMGPSGASILAQHRSFASLYHAGAPVLPQGRPWWKSDGGPYEYAHSGYAWCWTRDALNRVGGQFELGGMGSGDYHMATALVGDVEWSIVRDTTTSYEESLRVWQARALAHVNRKIGWTQEVIHHDWHGSKKRRGYIGRWEMFERNGFNPITDLKRNIWGVLEFAGNKPDLEREFDNYLRARAEDANID